MSEPVSPTTSVRWGAGVNMGILPEVGAELRRFQQQLGVDVYVTSAFRPNDKGSQHALGLAVDIVVPAYAGRLFDLYLVAEHFAFKGIGVYPDWQFNGQAVGGLHLDKRVGKSARWLGLGRGVNNQYLALNQENLKAHGVIA